MLPFTSVGCRDKGMHMTSIVLGARAWGCVIRLCHKAVLWGYIMGAMPGKNNDVAGDPE